MLEIARHHYVDCLSINGGRCLGKMTGTDERWARIKRGLGKGSHGRGKQWARFNYRACKKIRLYPRRNRVSTLLLSLSPSLSPPLSPITSANSFPVGILGKSGTRPMLFHRVTSLLPDFIFFSFLPAYFLVYSFANATSYKRPWNNSALSSSSSSSFSLSLSRGSSFPVFLPLFLFSSGFLAKLAYPYEKFRR